MDVGVFTAVTSDLVPDLVQDPTAPAESLPGVT